MVGQGQARFASWVHDKIRAYVAPKTDMVLRVYDFQGECSTGGLAERWSWRHLQASAVPGEGARGVSAEHAGGGQQR